MSQTYCLGGLGEEGGERERRGGRRRGQGNKGGERGDRREDEDFHLLVYTSPFKSHDLATVGCLLPTW